MIKLWAGKTEKVTVPLITADLDCVFWLFRFALSRLLLKQRVLFVFHERGESRWQKPQQKKNILNFCVPLQKKKDAYPKSRILPSLMLTESKASSVLGRGLWQKPDLLNQSKSKEFKKTVKDIKERDREKRKDA